mmetsp:Transcript_43588/g.105694  ORF Transcript_43588/g.105694 Transcript_43588/m.105694 type:complete len:218 (+) Transcript_43588:232-885(+)
MISRCTTMMAMVAVLIGLLVAQQAEGFTSPVVVSTTPKTMPNNHVQERSSTTTATPGSSSSTSLGIYGQHGYDRGWNYDYGGGLAYGTDQYRQRYNDGYNGGVNLSYNGYSQQTNVSRNRGRLGGGYGGYGRGGYYDDDYYGGGGYGGYGGYGGMSGGYGRGGYGRCVLFLQCLLPWNLVRAFFSSRDFSFPLCLSLFSLTFLLPSTFPAPFALLQL